MENMRIEEPNKKYIGKQTVFIVLFLGTRSTGGIS